MAAALADYILTKVPQSTDGGLLPLVAPTTAFSHGYSAQGIVSASLGFTFTFDGVGYTSVDLTAHGNAKLAGTHCGSGVDDNGIEGACNVVLLAPWWDTLTTANGSEDGHVRHETRGTAPNRLFIAQWRVWPYGHVGGHHQLMTFQIALYETSNRIEFRYASAAPDYVKTGSPGFGGSVSASIGVRVDTTSEVDGHFREFTELLGTPSANGGVDTAGSVYNACQPQIGSEWPGDSTNAIEGYAFNYHFAPPAAAAGSGYSTPAHRRTPAEADHATYVGAILGLLPRGDRIWSLMTESRLRDWARAAAKEWGRVHNRLLDLLDEADPRTADETIDGWEELLGLPRDGYTPTTLAERQAAAWAAYTASGGGSADYLVEMAARHGYTITITRSGDFPAWRCDSSGCDEPLRGESWLFSFTVYGSTADEDGVRSLIDRLCPSDSLPHYVFT